VVRKKVLKNPLKAPLQGAYRENQNVHEKSSKKQQKRGKKIMSKNNQTITKTEANAKQSQANSNQREIYKLKLENLLNQCIFYGDDNLKEFTPRESFLESYDQLNDAPFMYFKSIADEIDNEVADKELKEWIKDGGNAKASYLLLKRDIEILDKGTLELNQDMKVANNIPNEAPLIPPYEAYTIDGFYGATNKIIIEADNLLGMERAFKFQLESVQEMLSHPYSADSDETTRSVLEKLS